MRKIINIFNIFIIPTVIIGMLFTFIHLFIHMGNGKIMIPEWYVAKKTEPINVSLIMDYWYGEAFKWGTNAGLITFLIICIVFAIYKSKLFIKTN